MAFPDGVVPCSEFPSQYGAVPVGLTSGGWTGLQRNGGNDDAIGECLEGALCSYDCPAGYSKSQYPASQPASGESLGGLLCKGGFLYKTRPEVPQLCEAGSKTAFVENLLAGHVAVCRTDYPGTENMVLPVGLSSGEISPLTSPFQDTAYRTVNGGKTSAHYYLNREGLSVDEACRWGEESQDLGNWAPIVLGASFVDGKTWLSITKNELNPNSDLGYNVRIVGKDGGQVSQDCRYENGVITGQGYGDGCTVALSGSDQATFQFYN
ncbi:YNL066Wp-like protein [Pyronema omphalodes]|nr:YNL066Wp-like protein [Pyronema omphalodes]